MLARAGVKFAFSSGDNQNVRLLPFQAAMSVAWGLDRDAAIKALTIDAAEILGVANRVGSLEPGKDANLFIATGDPLEIRSQVTHVVIAGRDVGTGQQARSPLPQVHRKAVGVQAIMKTSTHSDSPSSRSRSAAAMAVGASADAPHVYAIKGARIVPVSGPAIASGTVVIRNGLIEAVGASVAAPAEAHGDRRQRPDGLSRPDRHGATPPASTCRSTGSSPRPSGRPKKPSAGSGI